MISAMLKAENVLIILVKILKKYIYEKIIFEAGDF